MNSDVQAYHADHEGEARWVCEALARQIDEAHPGRWLAESRTVQWDYKNIVERKGRLERLR